MDRRSPLTVAGAAPELSLSARTGFPFHPGFQRGTNVGNKAKAARATSRNGGWARLLRIQEPWRRGHRLAPAEGGLSKPRHEPTPASSPPSSLASACRRALRPSRRSASSASTNAPTSCCWARRRLCASPRSRRSARTSSPSSPRRLQAAAGEFRPRRIGASHRGRSRPDRPVRIACQARHAARPGLRGHGGRAPGARLPTGGRRSGPQSAASASRRRARSSSLGSTRRSPQLATRRRRGAASSCSSGAAIRRARRASSTSFCAMSARTPHTERLGLGRGGTVSLERLVADPPDYVLMADSDRDAIDQGSALLWHPALRRAIPPERRLYLPDRLTICGGPRRLTRSRARSGGAGEGPLRPAGKPCAALAAVSPSPFVRSGVGPDRAARGDREGANGLDASRRPGWPASMPGQPRFNGRASIRRRR